MSATPTITLRDAHAHARRPAARRIDGRGGHGLAGPFGQAAGALLRTLAVWRERARQRRVLAAMDDHLLKDIGLTRIDVDQETGKPFWRP